MYSRVTWWYGTYFCKKMFIYLNIIFKTVLLIERDKLIPLHII